MLNRKIVSIKIPKEGFLDGTGVDPMEHLTLANAILIVEEERTIFRDTAKADLHMD